MRDYLLKKNPEQKMLNQIAMLSSAESSLKVEKEFNSKYNNYDFYMYIQNLEEVKNFLLLDITDINLIIRSIRQGISSDYYIKLIYKERE